MTGSFAGARDGATLQWVDDTTVKDGPRREREGALYRGL